MSILTENYYTREQLASLAGVSLATTYTWESQGKFPEPERVFGRVFFPKAKADAWLKTHRDKKARAA
jgi:predicted DNA-binding transcriptional regulator AlpA